MRIYPKFLLITAGLLVFAVVGGYYGSRVGFAGIFPNQYTMYIAVFMGIVFVFGHYEIHGVVYRIVRDLQTLDSIDKLLWKRVETRKSPRGVPEYEMVHASKTMDPASLRELILDVCHHPERVLKTKPSRVSVALRQLAMRHDLSMSHHVKTPINRSVYHANFEARIDNDINRVDSLMVLYVMMAFFAFLVVLYLTFRNIPFPKTVEEVAEYSRHLLTGLGQTYLLTIIGLGSALITHIINMRVCDRHKAEVAERFQDVTFSVIFPVLHGSLTKGPAATEDHNEAT